MPRGLHEGGGRAGRRSTVEWTEGQGCTGLGGIFASTVVR